MKTIMTTILILISVQSAQAYSDYYWPLECDRDEYTDYCLDKWEDSYCSENESDTECVKYKQIDQKENQ